MTLLGSVKRRLFAGMTGLLVLVLAMAVTGLNAMRTLDREGQENLALVAGTTRLALAMSGRLAEQVRSAETYLVAPSPALRGALIELGDSVYASARAFARIEGLTQADLETLNRVSDRQSRIEVAYARAHALFDLAEVDSARRLALAIHPVADSLLTDVQALTLAQATLAEARAEELRRNVRQRQIMLWLLLGSAILLGGGITVWSVQSIDSPLGRLIVATGRLGDGDLRPAELGAMPEELQRLARSIHRMGAHLRGVVDNVVKEARNIAASAGDFSAASEQLAASSGEIATEMHQVSETAAKQVRAVQEAEKLFAELRGGVGRNASDSEEVVDLAERIRATAEYHQESISSASSTLLAIRDIVQAAGADVGKLAKQADAIEAFVATVREIADQCGVLAVNASIEGARLGEAGEGFGVIAQEMRSLAERSSQAAENASDAAESIREGIIQAAGNLEMGGARVLVVESTAKRAAGALEEIRSAVDDVGTAAKQVAGRLLENRTVVAALAARSAEVDRIARAHAATSDAVTSSSREQTASTEEIAATAQSLFEAAQRLQALVADFKT